MKDHLVCKSLLVKWSHHLQVDKLEGSTIGYGLLTLCVSLVFRMLTSFLVVMGGQLNLRERLFVALAWLPKATVQVRGFAFYLLTNQSLIIDVLQTFVILTYCFAVAAAEC